MASFEGKMEVLLGDNEQSSISSGNLSKEN